MGYQSSTIEEARLCQIGQTIHGSPAHHHRKLESKAIVMWFSPLTYRSCEGLLVPQSRLASAHDQRNHHILVKSTN